MNKVFLFLITIAGFAACSVAHAASQGDILINEIAWMGTTNSANDEWIELFNNTENPIDVSGWIIKSTDDPSASSGQAKLKINLKGIIPSKAFYLLERTDNNSVPHITADLIYKGALTNSGMDLKLSDNSNNLIDEANYSITWPAGDNNTKQTMERTAMGWQTSKDPRGTPKSENSSGVVKKVLANTSSLKTADEVKPLPEPKKSDNTNSVSTAAVSQPLESTQELLHQKESGLTPWLLFLISLGSIISLAIIVLVVKIKLKK